MDKLRINISTSLKLDTTLAVETLLDLLQTSTDEEKARAVVELLFEDLEDFLDAAELSMEIRDSEGEEIWKSENKH
jgi:predicted DNA-binding protein